MKKAFRKQLTPTSQTLRLLTADLHKIDGGRPNDSVGQPCVSLSGTSSCCSIYSKCASLCCL
jgi:hypothetical protein